MMIRLLLVEDRAAVRQGLQMLLAAEADLSVIGAAPDSEAALRLAASLHPDIVLMDLDMVCLDGIATASSLRQICPQTDVIMLSFRDDVHIRADATNAGVAAFVAKFMPAEVLLTAIRHVSQTRCALAKGERRMDA